MGLKFLCHHCNEPMHVKNFLAGKRGKCPNCNQSIRIPEEGEEYSRPVTRGDEVAGSGDSLREPTSTSSTAQNVISSTSASADIISVPFSKPQEKELGGSPASSQTSNTPPPPPGEIEIPKCIAEAPNAAWYVRPTSGGQYGPAVGAVFWDWLKEKRVGESALVWREGWGTWQTANSVFPEFFHSSSPKTSQSSAKLPPPPETSTSNLTDSSASNIKSENSVKANLKSSTATPRNRNSKKKRTSKRDIAIFIGLSILALVLIAVLIWVLISQVK